MALLNHIKDWDMFGQPVQFNYRGKSEYTTVPGGLLSIVLRVVGLVYLAFRMQLLIFDGDWTLTSQTIATSDENLS